MYKLVAVLVAAHILADFLLQTDELVKRKRKARFLLLHAAIHAVLTYVVLQTWTCWLAPLYVLVVHAFVDFGKQHCGEDSWISFLVDQGVHIVSLFALAWVLTRYFHVSAVVRGYKPLICFAGYIATVNGAGFLIGKFAKDLLEKNKLKPEGLPNGGTLIGQLERTLIFLFIFLGQPGGIGFLVAAKSILRFEEAKKQVWAEYVLIGTLLSFSAAVALAMATKWAMNLEGC